MTEGSSVRTKRMGARFFKNPPQPYMCIRDTLMGSCDPCYVNVLSWDKVPFASVYSDDVPLYGGMKVCPPRTEKKEISIFAVMAHPDVLRQHGKNADNPKQRTWLIDILLDFVEKMNNGVIFNRRYTVLRDRDITGELKEIWMVVQSDRAKTQQAAGGEELRRPVPQYSSSQEQQQQYQQQHQLSQTHQHSPQHQQQQQQHQQQLQQQLQPHAQQQQQSITREEHTQQPPQYHSSVYYNPESSEKLKTYELRYGYQAQNRSKDRPYQMAPMNQQYPINPSQNDQYVFRDPITPPNSQVAQQNCLAYQAYQTYHMNPPPNCPPPHPASPMNLVRTESLIRFNKFTSVKEILETINRKPSQPQQIPQSSHIQMAQTSPTGYYDTQNSSSTNVIMLRPEEPEAARRISAHVARTRSFVMPQTTENVFVPPVAPLQQPQFPVVSWSPMHLPQSNTSGSSSMSREANSKKPSTIGFLKLFRPQEAETSWKNSDQATDIITTGSIEKKESPNVDGDISKSRETSNTLAGPQQQQQQQQQQFTATRDQNSKKGEKPKTEDNNGWKKVLKRNKSVGDEKGPAWDAKIMTNGDADDSDESKTKDRSSGNDADVEDRLEIPVPEAERNGNADEQRIDVTRVTTGTRNTVKIFAGGGNEIEEAGCVKKSNGYQAVTSQTTREGSEEILQVYTILRKPEAITSQEDVTSEMAQISIKEARPVWRRGERGNDGIGDRRSGARRVGQAMRPR